MEYSYFSVFVRVNKTKKISMITEDKITEIFCIVDDFCKFYDALMAKYTFKVVKKRSYNHDGRMSKAKVMMIMILFHSSSYRYLKLAIKQFYILEPNPSPPRATETRTF